MRLYLAGPDVFRPDARARADAARALCASRGHGALLPLDNEATTAAAIFAANVALIRSADAVIADLNPFRGSEPDSGTAWEVGFALALGKPVVGYLADIRPQAEKLLATAPGSGPSALPPRDPNGFLIEHFGLPVNLMLAVPCRIVAGGLAEALAVVDTLPPPGGAGDRPTE